MVVLAVYAHGDVAVAETVDANHPAVGFLLSGDHCGPQPQAIHRLDDHGLEAVRRLGPLAALLLEQGIGGVLGRVPRDGDHDMIIEQISHGGQPASGAHAGCQAQQPQLGVFFHSHTSSPNAFFSIYPGRPGKSTPRM